MTMFVQITEQPEDPQDRQAAIDAAAHSYADTEINKGSFSTYRNGNMWVTNFLTSDGVPMAISNEKDIGQSIVKCHRSVYSWFVSHATRQFSR